MHNKNSTRDIMVDAMRLQEGAAALGFDWPTVMPVFEKVQEEVDEVRDELLKYLADTNSTDSTQLASSRHSNASVAMLENEIGDLLFAIINLCRHLELSPEVCLQSTNSKFSRRFQYVQQRVLDSGSDITKTDLSVLERFWQLAKREEQGNE